MTRILTEVRNTQKGRAAGLTKMDILTPDMKAVRNLQEQEKNDRPGP